MYYCCKSVGNCFERCCNAIGQCCADFCHCISDIFSEPFSFVTFLSFFVSGGPFIYGIITYAQYKDLKCFNWIQIHLIILAISHLVNFIFFLYLFCNFANNKKKLQGDKFKDKTVCETVGYLILYDFGVCFYMLIYIFEIVWIIIGHDLYKQEADDKYTSPCFTSNNANLMKCQLVLLIIMDIYIFLTLLGGVISMLYYACEEGSCACDECCNCICFILSCGYCCGLCCIGQQNRKSKYKYNENQKNSKFVKQGSNVAEGMNWKQQQQQIPQQQQQYAYNPQQVAYNPNQAAHNPQQVAYNPNTYEPIPNNNPNQVKMQQQPPQNQGYNYPQMNQAVNQQPYQYNNNNQNNQMAKKKKPFWDISDWC